MAQHNYPERAGMTISVNDTCPHCSADTLFPADADPQSVLHCSACKGLVVVQARFSDDRKSCAFWVDKYTRRISFDVGHGGCEDCGKALVYCCDGTCNPDRDGTCTSRGSEEG
jgi:hypothetical protein